MLTVHQSLKFPPWSFVKYYFRCYEVFLHAQLVLYIYIRPLNVKETQITFFSLTRPHHHLQFYLITTCHRFIGSFSIILQSVYLYRFEFAIVVDYILTPTLHSWHHFLQKSCLGFVPNISTVTVAGQTALISACPNFFTFIFFRKVNSTLPPVDTFQ